MPKFSFLDIRRKNGIYDIKNCLFFQLEGIPFQAFASLKKTFGYSTKSYKIVYFEYTWKVDIFLIFLK